MSTHDKKIKILIAEDDLLIQKLYEIGLRDSLFDKQYAADGEIALMLYSSWNPDIVLLDFHLPVFNGYSVLKTISRSYEDNATTIIMATGSSSKDSIQNCLVLGIQGYIVKPIKYDTLLTKVIVFHYSKISK